MKQTTLCLIALQIGGLFPLCAQGTSSDAKPQVDPQEIAVLRQKVAEQQRQLDELRKQMGDTLQALDRLMEAKPAQPAQVAAAPQQLMPVAQPPEASRTSPLEFQIGVMKVKPGGFLDLGYVYRTTNVGSGLPTAFATIPYADTVQGNLNDSRFSAQNSRVNVTVNADFKGLLLTGYVESDYLGTAPSNIAVSSNGGTFRMRQYWAQMGRSKWSLMAGQAWSLLTPNRTGVGSYPSALFTTLNEDPNYMVGFVWSRDPQVRFMYKPTSAISFAGSLESPDQYTGGFVTLPAGLASAYTPQFDTGSSGLSAPTFLPDLVGKIAWDATKRGRQIHLESAGIIRSFRVFNPVSVERYTSFGYGGTANGNVELFRGFRLIVNTFFSTGGGRYSFGLGPDVAVRVDGSLATVPAFSTLSGFEYVRQSAEHPNGVTTGFFGYYGASYFDRVVLRDANGSYIGFGYPGSSSSDNRSLQQLSLGFNRKVWRSPTYGVFGLIGQYSYITRSPWWIQVGRPPNANLNMVQIGVRYELP
jgi:hypothetical protein